MLPEKFLGVQAYVLYVLWGPEWGKVLPWVTWRLAILERRAGIRHRQGWGMEWGQRVTSRVDTR